MNFSGFLYICRLVHLVFTNVEPVTLDWGLSLVQGSVQSGVHYKSDDRFSESCYGSSGDAIAC